MARNAARGPEGGFNLIEVIVALALLAAVLLTISGLFIQGGQSVNTGRDLTEATSLATSVLEEMDKWAFSQLYTNFCKATTDGAFSIATNSSAAASCTAFASTASGWQGEINRRLPNAKATLAITPLGGATFGAAKGIRIQVTVDWVLKLRPRQVSLETVRF